MATRGPDLGRTARTWGEEDGLFNQLYEIRICADLFPVSGYGDAASTLDENNGKDAGMANAEMHGSKGPPQDL